MVDEYNPSRPNDYEELLLEREQKKKEQEEQNRIKRDRERLEAEAAERRKAASMGFAPPASKGGFAIPPPKGFSKPKMDLNVSADEAYKRRMAMSAPQGLRPLGSAVIPKSKGSQFGAGRGPPSRPPAPSFSEPQAPPSSNYNTTSPTRVVLLRNMVGRGEVDNELEREVAEECTKYGRVNRCVAWQVPGNVPDTEAVRIFVQFGSIKAAIAAMQGLNGRFFAGRTVKASYYSELKLTMKDFMA